MKAEPFPSVKTPTGIRKPDLWCENSGAYVIEAKFRERDLIDALSKIQNDYIRWYELLGLKGGFAILYPEELSRPLPRDVVIELANRLKFKVVTMFPPKDVRKNFTVYEGTLREIANFLAEHILRPPEYVEPSLDFIIMSLREAANYITTAMKYLTGRDLEELFGGRDVFRDILQYEERKYPVESLRLASAYLLVNQLLFYHVLSRRRSDLFPEIDTDKISKPSDLNEYFKKVLNVNYRSIFSYDVASRIPSGFTKEISTVINAIKAISPEKVGRDLLGTIFHDLVPFEVRKTVAAFYTNVLAAELLAWLSIDRENAKVADLACGSGGLLVAAYRRKRYLLERQGKPFTQDDHKRFVEKELLGIDVMPFAANIAACNLALQSPEFFTNKVNIAIWDSTELRPGRKIPSIAGLRFVFKGQPSLDLFLEPEERGVVRLAESVPEEVNLERYDVVIMNPPFTRQERIPEEYKRKLQERFSEYREYLHGQLGYYGYFIFLADRFLKENGRIALVLPATVLRVKSCEGVRRLLAKHYHVEHIVTTWQRSAFSESVRFREILLIARKISPSGNLKTTITVLKRLPKDPGEAREIAELLRQARDYEDDRLVTKTYVYSRLRDNTRNWFKYIALRDLNLMNILEELLSSEKLVPLSSIAETQRADLEHFKFKDFHGFILYDKSRIQKKYDVWIVDRVKDNSLLIKHVKLNWKIEIPLDHLGRGLRRLSYVTQMDVTEVADYLIIKWFNKIRDMARLLLNVRDLEKMDENIIKSWREKFERKKANILLARRFDVSAPGTSLLAFYSENPLVGVDMWSLQGLDKRNGKILTLWLNSTISLFQFLVLRTETRGAWMKIHDYMLDDMLVPNPRSLNEEDYLKLETLFNELSKYKFNSILDQLKNKNSGRLKIDRLWLEILGLKDITGKFLKNLYDSLAEEILLLKEIMKEKS
ncbi:MAG: hypothetical protein DRJ41_01675 [Thermoprotei archaeon]|nr:MAG: hypothetical protein DRJ41_01675 [Thermoprotei archaeon]